MLLGRWIIVLDRIASVCIVYRVVSRSRCESVQAKEGRGKLRFFVFLLKLEFRSELSRTRSDGYPFARG